MVMGVDSTFTLQELFLEKNYCLTLPPGSEEPAEANSKEIGSLRRTVEGFTVAMQHLDPEADEDSNAAHVLAHKDLSNL